MNKKKQRFKKILISLVLVFGRQLLSMALNKQMLVQLQVRICRP